MILNGKGSSNWLLSIWVLSSFLTGELNLSLYDIKKKYGALILSGKGSSNWLWSTV